MKWQYDAAFEHSSEFSSHVLANLPDDRIQLIDQGNEGFFAPLRKMQPETYGVLTKECGRVRLYEEKLQLMGMTAKKSEDYLHMFALECPSGIIFAHPPRFLASTANAASGFITAIPESFWGFYTNMEGMSRSLDGRMTGLIDLDLPANRSGWMRVDRYFRESGADSAQLEQLINKFKNDDLRVFVCGTRGDIVFVNLSTKDQILHHVHKNDFTNFHAIENAPEVLDRYFANAIRGFPEPVRFH